MKLRYYAVAVLMTLAAVAAYAWLLPEMPARVGIHWNARGQVDGFGPVWMLLVLGPGVMTLSLLLFVILPWISPRRFEVETFERTYLELMLAIVALQGYVFGVLLWTASGRPLYVPTALVGGLAVLHVFIGNILGKVRRNFYIGIRTPWTLADERVWYASHRFAGKTMVATGVAALMLLFAGVAFWLALVLLLLGVAAPVVHSLIYYKHLERAGELGIPG